MTAEEYLAQNELGFEGDVYLRTYFEILVDQHDIKAIIETGTYLGSTTVKFAEIVDKVFTIEIKKEYQDKAKVKFEGKNIESFLGNSAHVLPKVIEKVNGLGNILFFLDAHWNDYNPLLHELKIIADAGLKPVIAIHDFKVPDRPDLGYDSYKGQDYDFNWIAASLNAIYGHGGFTYFYNETATVGKRGVIFIEPK